MNHPHEVEKKEEIACSLCGDLFTCEHNMIEELDGQKLKVPHCKKCFYDNGNCPDKHGYQCAKCQEFASEFNPK